LTPSLGVSMSHRPVRKADDGPPRVRMRDLGPGDSLRRMDRSSASHNPDSRKNRTCAAFAACVSSRNDFDTGFQSVKPRGLHRHQSRNKRIFRRIRGARTGRHFCPYPGPDIGGPEARCRRRSFRLAGPGFRWTGRRRACRVSAGRQADRTRRAPCRGLRNRGSMKVALGQARRKRSDFVAFIDCRISCSVTVTWTRKSSADILRKIDGAGVRPVSRAIRFSS